MSESVEGVWSDDLMDRGPSADFLTSYLLANDHIKVLNVNSPWGAGKSFFMARWSKLLSAEHVCVNFNAWESDYTSEPLVALIACMEQQLVDPLALESTEVGKSVINASSELVKKAGPLILKGLVRKFSGVELDELLGDGAQEAADDVVKSLIEEQAKTKNNVAEFKKEVRSRLSKAAVNQGKKAPAFIFIDELDRCRPTYAIELLERIKHFFELENCRFIIASDSTQLAHSIRAVYGQGFASERYLNRFFDAEFNLDNQDVFPLVHQTLPVIHSVSLRIRISAKASMRQFGSNVSIQPGKNTVTCEIPEFSENALIIVGLIRYFSVELRELVNYIKQIKSAADAIGGRVNFFWLAFLVFYKNSKHESYSLLFDKEKGVHAFSEFDKNHLNSVTFMIGAGLEQLPSIAHYYLKILNSDSLNSGELASKADGWRGEIYFSVCDNLDELRSYKKIVDLAHRLK